MLENNFKKHIKQLHQKKFRKEFGEFLIEGVKGVAEAIDTDAEIIAIIIDGKKRDDEKILEIVTKANSNDLDIFYAGRNDLDDIKTTETFPGIMAIVAVVDTQLDDLMRGGPIVCIDGVNDPGNLGTIIRTGDWFGVSNILLSEKSVEVYNEKVVRSTMGSIFRSNIFKSNDLLKTLEKLKGEGYSLYGFGLNGKIGNYKLESGKVVYIFGSESHGIRKEVLELCDGVYTIEKRGEAESLNLGVAVGIALSRII